jgi:hypothetical protein
LPLRLPNGVESRPLIAANQGALYAFSSPGVMRICNVGV